MPKYLSNVRYWVNSGKHLLALSYVRARKARRMVFSIVLSRQPSPALLFFKLIEVEMKFPFANSISEFSRSQDPQQTFNGDAKLALGSVQLLRIRYGVANRPKR